MLTFEERVLCENPLQRFGSRLEPDPEPTREFGPIAYTIHNHLNQMTKNRKEANRRALHPMRHSEAHSMNPDTSDSAATLPMNFPKNGTQDAHAEIVRKTGTSKNAMQHSIGCEYIQTVVDGW